MILIKKFTSQPTASRCLLKIWLPLHLALIILLPVPDLFLPRLRLRISDHPPSLLQQSVITLEAMLPQPTTGRDLWLPVPVQVLFNCLPPQFPPERTPSKDQ